MKPIVTRTLVWIKGGGDLGTGVAHRLHRAGLQVIISELPQPLVVRRTVSFASAIYEGRITIEGIEARSAYDAAEIESLLAQSFVPVIPDPTGQVTTLLQPDVAVDARMAKRSLDTTLCDAPIVIGLGPGFVAGQDVHAVIETMRGHDLGRVILEGRAQPDTRVPGAIQGYSHERVLRAPCSGLFRGQLHIGEHVERGQIVAYVGEHPVSASITGVLRGLLHDGLIVQHNQKLGDIDPRGIVEHCFTISDKARAVAGGVLEAILYLARKPQPVSCT